jgi:hypothetical protein
MARQSAKLSIVSGVNRPDFKKIKKDSKTFKVDFDTAMYYAHYELSSQNLKDECVKYAKIKKLAYKNIETNSVHDFATIGKICYILNRGAEVPDNWHEYTDAALAKFAEKVSIEEVVETTTEQKPVISIQDRMRDLAEAVSTEFDGWVDEFITDPQGFKPDSYNPYSVMVKAELKAGHARFIPKFYTRNKAEVELVISGNADAQLIEGYGCYTKAQLKKLIKLYETIESAAKMIIDSSKTARKPRAKKAVSVDKIVDKLKYRKEDPALSIVSINPREIVGAQELWVYNTKTCKIGRYIALDSKGLNVKSATILNYTELSVEKTLRKPELQLKEFKAAGKVALRTFIDKIGTIDTKLKSRINENHILLKVIK